MVTDTTTDKPADEKKTEGKKVANKYKEGEGISLRANLYIIKHIYYSIQIADCFVEKVNAGRKKKRIPVYHQELGMSRQRFERISKGEPFVFGKNEIANISEKFGLDKKYFTDENELFNIEGVKKEDWEGFFEYRGYSEGDTPVTESKPNNEKDTSVTESKPNNEKGTSVTESDPNSKTADKVRNALNKYINKEWKKNLRSGDPLYAVCFYFSTGRRYEAQSNVFMINEILSRMDCSEWEGESIEQLKKAYELLKKHYSYVNALWTLEKLRKKQ